MAQAAKAVVALITPAYQESAFCLAELGAAWVLQSRRFPIVVPPNDFSVMNATLLGIVAIKLDNWIELNQLVEELEQAIGKKAPASGVRARAFRDFEKVWAREVKSKLSGPTRIDSSVHAAKLKELEAALGDRDEADDLLLSAKKQIEALKKAKDKKEVAKIESDFSDNAWEPNLIGGKTVAQDILAVVDYFRQQPFIDADQVILVGHSLGGAGSLVAAGRHPEGVLGVVAFAPGAGRVRPGLICRLDVLEKAFEDFGAGDSIPALWIYTENDDYFSPEIAQRLFEAYGKGAHAFQRLEILPSTDRDDHDLFLRGDGASTWGRVVEHFLDQIVH